MESDPFTLPIPIGNSSNKLCGSIIGVAMNKTAKPSEPKGGAIV